jgi:hypothetical protein
MTKTLQPKQQEGTKGNTKENLFAANRVKCKFQLTHSIYDSSAAQIITTNVLFHSLSLSLSLSLSIIYFYSPLCYAELQ